MFVRPNSVIVHPETAAARRRATNRVVVAIAAALLVAAAADPRSAPSLKATWLVTNVHGTVTAQRGSDAAVAINTGDRILAGTRIRSQARGHVTLMRDGDVVQVDADSSVELAVTDWGTPAKAVVQTFGEATYKVKSEPTKPFKVRTPFLTAAGTGTAFTVTVGHDSADVKISKGAVEVWSVLSGETSVLSAGQIAHASIRDMMEAREVREANEAKLQAAAAAGAAPTKSAKASDKGAKAPTKTTPEPQIAEVPAGFEDAPVLPADDGALQPVAPRPVEQTRPLDAIQNAIDAVENSDRVEE